MIIAQILCSVWRIFFFYNEKKIIIFIFLSEVYNINNIIITLLKQLLLIKK